MDDIFISGGGRRNGSTGEIPSPPRRTPGAQTGGKRPKKRGGHRHLKRFLALLSVLVLLVLAAGVYVYTLASRTVYTPDESSGRVSGLSSSPLVTNLLLIGVDRREGESVSRSDTMLLVSADSRTRTVKLTSFLRDLWIDIPDCGYAKLNAACSYGGAELVAQTIESSFGVEIDGYLLVDFVMFSRLVDAMGGVEVEVTPAESRALERDHGISVDSGESVRLDGTQALWFCRIRKLDSDFMRTSRQRKVVSAIIGKAKGAGAFKLLASAGDIVPNIETNISPARLSALALRGAAWLTYDIETRHIPADGTWEDATRNGQDVLLADIEENADIIKSFIYGE